jgi:hypothetical protein
MLPERHGRRVLSSTHAPVISSIACSWGACSAGARRRPIWRATRWPTRTRFDTRAERAARRSRRLAPDVVDEEGKVTREGEERRLLAMATLCSSDASSARWRPGAARASWRTCYGRTWTWFRRELRVRTETSKTRRSPVLRISARLAGVLEMACTALEAVLFDGAGAATEQERARRIARCHVFGDALGLRLDSPADTARRDRDSGGHGSMRSVGLWRTRRGDYLLHAGTPRGRA